MITEPLMEAATRLVDAGLTIAEANTWMDYTMASYGTEDLPNMQNLSPKDLLYCCFVWWDTPEGSDYWAELANMLKGKI